jgi:hypothetical protein
LGCDAHPAELSELLSCFAKFNVIGASPDAATIPYRTYDSVKFPE